MFIIMLNKKGEELSSVGYPRGYVLMMLLKFS